MKKSPAAPRRKPRAPSRLYAFGVTSLALLLVLLVAWRPPIVAYTTESTIRVEAAEGAELPDLMAILATAQTGEPSAHGVTLEVAGLTEEGRASLVRLRVTAPQEAAAREAATLAAEQFVRVVTAWQPPPDENALRHDEARRAAAAARATLLEAERKLDEFLTTHSLTLAFATGESIPAPTPRPNPAWQELEERAAGFEAERKELLRTLTRQHPEIRELDQQIATARAEQQSLPRELAAEGTEGPPAIERPASGELLELRSRLEERKTAVAAAQTTFREAQRAEQQAAAAVTPTVLAPPSATVEQAGQTVSLAAAPTSPRMLIKALLLATFGGLIVAILMPRHVTQFFLNSVEDVARAISLPLVGALSTGPGPPRQRDCRWRRRITGGLVACAEFVVIASAVVVLVGIVAWPGWAAELTADPLSAVQQVVVQVLDSGAGV